ncbi:MAG: HAD-IA family hydrolase [Lachnospiraceae bacterium]|nr:HAD-IA family hydrolase [Lachnospiraceae bacterium]
MFKAIFFDIDDTLLSFQGYVKESMRTGFPLFGIGNYNEEMFPVFQEVNGELWRELERRETTMAALLHKRWNVIFDALGLSGDGVAFEAYFQEALNTSAILIPGAKELLSSLHGKYLLCAASNGPEFQQKNRMRIGGLAPYIDLWFISGEIGHSKPNKDYFDTCLERLAAHAEEEIPPEEILMVGDSMTSDMGAAAFGIKTCLYRPGYQGEALTPQPDYVVNTLLQIKELLI